MLEKWVQNAIIQKYGAHPRIRLARINTGVGWFNASGPCRKTDPNARPVRFNPPGCADIVGLIAPTGRLLMIEVKRAKGGKQSDQQVTMQRVIEAMGGIYILAKSVEDVDAVLMPILGDK